MKNNFHCVTPRSVAAEAARVETDIQRPSRRCYPLLVSCFRAHFWLFAVLECEFSVCQFLENENRLPSRIRAPTTKFTFKRWMTSTRNVYRLERDAARKKFHNHWVNAKLFIFCICGEHCWALTNCVPVCSVHCGRDGMNNVSDVHIYTTKCLPGIRLTRAYV